MPVYRIPKRKKVEKKSPSPQHMFRAGAYTPIMDGFDDLEQYGTQFKRTSPVRKSSKPSPIKVLNEIMRNFNEVTNLPKLSPRKSPKKRKRTPSPLRKSPPKRSPTLANRLANRRMYRRPSPPRHTYAPLRLPIRFPGR